MRDGRNLFAGYLSVASADEIAEHMATVLWDDEAGEARPYTVVMANEIFGWKPEIRGGLRLKERPVAEHRSSDAGASVGIVVEVPDTGWQEAASIGSSISSWHADQKAAYDDATKRKVHVAIYERAIYIRHHAMAGNAMWWVLAPHGTYFEEQA